MRNLASTVEDWIAASYFPAGKESHESPYSGEIQSMVMNQVLGGLNDPQIIDGIEATVRGSPERKDEPLLFVKAKAGDGNSQFSSRYANGIRGLCRQQSDSIHIRKALLNGICLGFLPFFISPVYRGKSVFSYRGNNVDIACRGTPYDTVSTVSAITR